jgi:hypothetical protein
MHQIALCLTVLESGKYQNRALALNVKNSCLWAPIPISFLRKEIERWALYEYKTIDAEVQSYSANLVDLLLEFN